MTFDMGPITTENQFPCQTLVAWLDCPIKKSKLSGDITPSHLNPT